MKILITGIGITGKSSFRQWLLEELANGGGYVYGYDCDYDREQLPTTFYENILYLIEDVHGPTENAVFPLKTFDRVFYLLPTTLTHLRFWLSRMVIWFENGHFAWDGDKGGWQGSGKSYDPLNIPAIIKEFWQNWKNRRKWIGEDMSTLKKSKIKIVIVHSQKKGGKIRFF